MLDLTMHDCKIFDMSSCFKKTGKWDFSDKEKFYVNKKAVEMEVKVGDIVLGKQTKTKKYEN